MSPMSPFLMGSGQNDRLDVQIPDYNEKCPICGSVLESISGETGGFPGHKLVRPSPLVGYQCSKCNRYFPLGEFMLLKGEIAWPKARSDFAKNYWKGVRIIFRDPVLYFVVVGFLLFRGFLAGIAAGIIIPFLLPLLTHSFRAAFAPLGRLFRKKFGSSPPNKPPDNP